MERMTTEYLLVLIEDLRAKMHREAEARGLSSPEVLAVSSELNEVLNEYQRRQETRSRRRRRKR